MRTGRSGALVACALLFSTCVIVACALQPGDRAPAFTVPTLDGPLRVGRGSPVLPLYTYAYDRTDPLLRYAWLDGPGSLAGLLQRAPAHSSYLFVSYAVSDAEAAADARWMRGQLVGYARRIRMPQRRLAAVMRRLHFATVPASRIPGWMPSLLATWQRKQRVAHFALTPAVGLGPTRSLTTGRIDAWYGWFPTAWSQPGPVPMVAAGADCDWIPADGTNAAGLSGRAALVSLTRLPSTDLRAPCNYVRLMRAATGAGATALVMVAPTGGDAAPANCTGSGPRSPINGQNACDTQVGPAAEAGLLPTMLQRSPEVASMLAALQGGTATVTANFEDVMSPGWGVGISAAGRLVEMGWNKMPTLMHAVWQAEYQVYLAGLGARLAAPALKLPVFNNVPAVGTAGARTTLTLPASVAAYDRLELDFTLGCPGPNDTSCPLWDHVLQLYVYCNNPDGSQPAADPCAGTPFAPFVPEGARAVTSAVGARPADTPLLCGRELGRWTSPFKVRDGRTLTDVSGKLALLTPGQQCTFTVSSPPWAGVWAPSLTLRFSSSGSQGWPPHHLGYPWRPQRPLRAATSVALPFNGGDFSQGRYDFAPFTFNTPAQRPPRVTIESIISGHGSDETWGCAEFCWTTHVMSVNGRSYAYSLGPSPGSLFGCSDRVPQGTTPNEHGTWTLGRGGWCNGDSVRPWVVDITAALAPPGRPNTITYRGLLGNGTLPLPPTQGAQIMMQSNLVFWERQQG